jgi:acyl-CoA thioesterase II
MMHKVDVDVFRSAIDASLDDLLAALEVRSCGNDCFTVEPARSGRPDRVFGGQLLAQAVVGATATVTGKDIHSLHASFLRAGTPGAPLRVQVSRLRDGRSIATREVAVLEAGEPLLVAIASFAGFHAEPDVAAVRMPDVVPPEETPTLQALVGEAPSGRQWIERPPALDLRLVELPSFLTGVSADSPRSHWMRLPRDVGAGHGLNAALLAYASDYFLMDMLFRLHPRVLGPGRANGFSLDHAIWFHRPARFDSWHLHTQEAIALVGDRGVARGGIHDASGRYVASVAQEVLLRLGPPS